MKRTLAEENEYLRARIADLEQTIAYYETPSLHTVESYILQGFSLFQSKILDLLARKGRVAHRTFIKALYENDPDGGPLDPRNTLKVTIYNLRKKLKPIGIEIQSSEGVYYVDDKSRDRLRALAGGASLFG